MFENEVVLVVRLQEGSGLDEKNIYFVYHKDLDLPTPHFSVQAGEENDEKFIQVSSDKLACNVMFCIPGESAFFSDNYIDIIPGRNYKIKVDTDLSPTQIQERIKIRYVH
ncbi:MAG: glycoside hydrolase family 2 protein [Butyricimonas paravirosa]